MAPADSLRPAVVTVAGHDFPPFLTVQPLLSRVAGVQVTPYSGAPGAMAAVRIRGAASLAGNPQPLYVVDGLPALQGPLWSAPNASQSTLYGAAPADFNPLLSLPVEDIESVTVLKGPLETARYGAQGQNGVVEIVTRRGQFGQAPRVRYSGAGGVQQARYRYDLLSAREYAEVANEIAAYQNQPPRFTATELNALGAGTDWQRELLRTAGVQEHHLGVEGGSATTRGYVGADYLRQTGILVNSDLQRLSLNTNLEQRLGSRLRLTLGAGLSQVTGHQPNPNVTLNFLTAAPTQTARDARGEPVETPNYFANPLRQALQTYQQPRQRRLLGRLGVEYQLAAGLHLELNAGLEGTDLHISGTTASGSGYLGSHSDRDDTYRKRTLHPVLRFERTFGSRHALTARLESWSQDYRLTAKYVEMFGAPASPLGPGGLVSISSSTSEQHFAAYQATAGYRFDGRYELQASLRRDGSSILLPTQRWQWLPAGQLTWHAQKAAFLRESNLISRLDLWAGWGRTSNSGNFDDRSYQVIVLPGGSGYENYYLFQTERTTQQEAGLHLGLQQHLTIAAAAYQRLTQVRYGGPYSTDPTLAEVRNRGLELTATSTWTAGPVRGVTSAAGAINQNRVALFDQYARVNAFGQRVLDGLPLSTFYGLRYLGVEPATGQPRYENVGTGDPNNFAARQNLGSGLPRQLLSLTQQLTYRRLSGQAQLDGLFGYQIYNANLGLLDVANGFYGANSSGRVRDRWQPTNPTTDVPAAGRDSGQLSTYLLQSGNHLRLTSLSVSLRVWEKAARSISVWVGGNNLLVFSAYRGFDPNVSSGGSDNKAAGIDAGAYPVARTVSVGVRAQL